MKDERFEADVRRLESLEAGYLRARDYLKSTEFEGAKTAALDRIRAISNQTDVRVLEGSQLLLGRIQEVLFGLDAHARTVSEYEALKKSLDTRHGVPPSTAER